MQEKSKPVSLGEGKKKKPFTAKIKSDVSPNKKKRKYPHGGNDGVTLNRASAHHPMKGLAASASNSKKEFLKKMKAREE